MRMDQLCEQFKNFCSDHEMVECELKTTIGEFDVKLSYTLENSARTNRHVIDLTINGNKYYDI